MKYARDPQVSRFIFIDLSTTGSACSAFILFIIRNDIPVVPFGGILTAMNSVVHCFKWYLDQFWSAF